MAMRWHLKPVSRTLPLSVSKTSRDAEGCYAIVRDAVDETAVAIMRSSASNPANATAMTAIKSEIGPSQCKGHQLHRARLSGSPCLDEQTRLDDETETTE